MQLDEVADGSIIKEIAKINERVSEKLGIKVALETPNIVVSGGGNNTGDKLKAQEEQMDKYIQEFFSLNARNQEVLDAAKKQIEEAMLENDL